MKLTFDKRVKREVFQVNDLVLRWDARREEKGKHKKIDNLWLGLFWIVEVLENNTFILRGIDSDESIGGPVNGRFLKIFFTN